MWGDRFKRGWQCLRGGHLEIWTAKQRASLGILLLALITVLLITATRRPLHIDDPQPVAGPSAAELATKIDPNQADWPTLAALPSIGEKRAKEIVAYREDFLRRRPTARAFENVEDLDNVKGIGEGTAESLRPYLHIPPRDGAP